jgi:polyisoprenoid-binding protein YceI
MFTEKSFETLGGIFELDPHSSRGHSIRFKEKHVQHLEVQPGRSEPQELQSLNKRAKTALLIVTMLVLRPGHVFGGSEAIPIDRAHSKITVYVYKTGVLSGLAHNHEIEAPIESGEINNSESPSVEVRVDSRKLRVSDPEASDSARTTIQATMQGAEVLDVARFPEIHFRSTEVEPSGTDHWVIHGSLELHGQSHPISFEVLLKDGFYQGAAVLKQTGFGITPVKVAGGTVKVKDEVKVAFSIAAPK